jgi:hypothetical protein
MLPPTPGRHEPWVSDVTWDPDATTETADTLASAIQETLALTNADPCASLGNGQDPSKQAAVISHRGSRLPPIVQRDRLFRNNANTV